MSCDAFLAVAPGTAFQRYYVGLIYLAPSLAACPGFSGVPFTRALRRSRTPDRARLAEWHGPRREHLHFAQLEETAAGGRRACSSPEARAVSIAASSPGLPRFRPSLHLQP